MRRIEHHKEERMGLSHLERDPISCFKRDFDIRDYQIQQDDVVPLGLLYPGGGGPCLRDFVTFGAEVHSDGTFTRTIVPFVPGGNSRRNLNFSLQRVDAAGAPFPGELLHWVPLLAMVGRGVEVWDTKVDPIRVIYGSSHWPQDPYMEEAMGFYSDPEVFSPERLSYAGLGNMVCFKTLGPAPKFDGPAWFRFKIPCIHGRAFVAVPREPYPGTKYAATLMGDLVVSLGKHDGVAWLHVATDTSAVWMSLEVLMAEYPGFGSLFFPLMEAIPATGAQYPFFETLSIPTTAGRVVLPTVWLVALAMAPGTSRTHSCLGVVAPRPGGWAARAPAGPGEGAEEFVPRLGARDPDWVAGEPRHSRKTPAYAEDRELDTLDFVRDQLERLSRYDRRLAELRIVTALRAVPEPEPPGGMPR